MENKSGFTREDFEAIVEEMKKPQPLQEYDFGWYKNSPIYMAYMEDLQKRLEEQNPHADKEALREIAEYETLSMKRFIEKHT